MFVIPLKVDDGIAWVRGSDIQMVWPRQSPDACDVYFYGMPPLAVLENANEVVTKWYASEMPEEDDDDEGEAE